MEHNCSQILLYTKEGKRVSIIQSFAYKEPDYLCKGKYGETVEVMIDGDKPKFNLNFEDLLKLLQSL